MFQNFDLSTRWVDCACGLTLDRDHNAAINILQRALMQDGWDTSVTDNAAPLPNPQGDGKRKRSFRSYAALAAVECHHTLSRTRGGFFGRFCRWYCRRFNFNDGNHADIACHQPQKSSDPCRLSLKLDSYP